MLQRGGRRSGMYWPRCRGGHAPERMVGRPGWGTRIRRIPARSFGSIGDCYQENSLWKLARSCSCAAFASRIGRDPIGERSGCSMGCGSTRRPRCALARQARGMAMSRDEEQRSPALSAGRTAAVSFGRTCPGRGVGRPDLLLSYRFTQAGHVRSASGTGHEAAFEGRRMKIERVRRAPFGSDAPPGATRRVSRCVMLKRPWPMLSFG